MSSVKAMQAPIRVVLTGGGTAGHVMPHIDLLEGLRKRGVETIYIGSNGIEKKIVADHRVPFYEIKAGKLRRYLSFQNLFDIFKVIFGFLQSVWLLWRLKPKLVFSKGGFVSVPVCVAARFLRIPVLSHESDLTPGLANRIIERFANRILYAFPDTAKYLRAKQNRLVGIPVRQELARGSREQAAELCHFQGALPTLLVMGGSLGAQRINEALLAILPDLIQRFHVIHICGQGKKISFEHPHYCSFEFLGTDLKHILALADFVVSRAGANSIFEFLALRKPMLLIPLEKGSRGDQIVNAECFSRLGLARTLREQALTPISLLNEIEALVANADRMRAEQAQTKWGENANETIIEEIINLGA